MSTRRYLTDHLEIVAEVSPIRRDEDGRYHWTVTDEFGTSTYRTNPGGSGAWVRVTDCDCRYGCDLCGAGTGWKQVLGTAQFDISDVSASTRRRRVLREFAVVDVRY